MIKKGKPKTKQKWNKLKYLNDSMQHIKMNPKEKVEKTKVLTKYNENEEGGKWKKNKPKIKGNKQKWKQMIRHKQVIKRCV